MNDPAPDQLAADPTIGAGVSDEEWDTWSVVVQVADAQEFMDAAWAVDELVADDPIPDCSESGVLADGHCEFVIEQPQPEARRQVQALIDLIRRPAQIVAVRRAE